MARTWLLIVGTASALGQRPGLPSNPPTTPATAAAPAGSTDAGTTAASSGRGASGSVQAARKARVTWSGGVLTIAAEDSSLNQILREVCRQTGMTVTGGVADERVYGSYGPGAPGMVLASLLLGTGSNMLLKENAGNGPVELVLTPRHGGATPPGPASYARSDEREEDLPPQRGGGRSRVFPGTPGGRVGAGGEVSGSPGGVPAASGANGDGASGAASASGAPAATTGQQSPNGVKTPQQIYDQLMKLQQQKSTTPATPPQ